MCKKKRKCIAVVQFPDGEGGFIQDDVEAYFHKWSTEAEFQNGYGFAPNAIGIIESQTTGKIYCVTPSAIRFYNQ